MKRKLCVISFLCILIFLILSPRCVFLGSRNHKEGATLLEVASIKIVDCPPLLAQIYGCPANAIFVTGDYALVAAGIAGLRIIHISNPTDPKVVVNIPIQDYAYDVHAWGTHAFVTAGPAGWPIAFLHLIDISEPDSPKTVASLELPDYPSGLYVKENFAFVADRSEGLRVIDVAIPTSPREIGYLDTPGSATDVFVVGKHAFVADGEMGLRVIEISASPLLREVGYLKTPGKAMSVFATQDYVFLAAGKAGLRIIDATEPTVPREIGHARTPKFAVDVFVQDQYAFVADAKAGMHVLDVSNPTAPKKVAFAETRGIPRSIFVKGNHVFLNDAFQDVSFLRVYQLPQDSLGVEEAQTDNYLKGIRESPEFQSLIDSIEMEVQMEEKDVWTVRVNSLVVAQTGELYAGTGKGIFRWEDERKSWVPSGLAEKSVQSLIVSGKILLAGVNNDYTTDKSLLVALFYSADGGATWIPVELPSGFNIPEDYLPTVGLPTYNLDAESLSVMGTTVLALVQAQSGPSFASHILRSEDSGKSWIKTHWLPQERFLETISISDYSIYIGGIHDFFRSDDDGKSWTEISNGLPDPSIHAFLAVNSSVYAGTSKGVFYLNKDDASWNQTELSGKQGYGLNGIMALAASDSRLYAAEAWVSGGWGEPTVWHGGVYVSDDGGASWQPTALTEKGVMCLAVSGQNLYAGTFHDGIFLTSDGGGSWSEINAGLPDRD